MSPDATGRDAPAWLVVGIPVALVLLFVTRPFNIDDPLFIWAARHIQTQPANPYGFTVNWYGVAMAMADVTKNPPLASYYMALVAAVFGWGEAALHLAFLVPALAVAGGTYAIAKRCCATPVWATLAAVVTPVFFVSSLTVMCDVIMLAFWVWAVYWWTRGIDTGSQAALGAAAVLIAGSALSKYFGIALMPLLLAYALFKTRGVGWWAAYLAIPAAMLAGYQEATRALYGRGLLLDVAAYVTSFKMTETGSALGTLSLAGVWVTLAFTGGCLATLVCFAGRLWSRRMLYAGCGLLMVSTLLLGSSPTFGIVTPPMVGGFSPPAAGVAHWLLAAQLGLWGTAGVSLLMLAALDFRHRRDADALLLLLWTAGAFVFAGFVNWTTNGRSILPLAVPAGLLIVRRIERQGAPARGRRVKAYVVPLAAAAALSLAVAWADTSFARSARAGAEDIVHAYPPGARTMWFQGHWGFQYYMEQVGGKAIDVRRSPFNRGDLIIVPSTNANLFPLPAWATVIGVIDVPTLRWLSTMNPRVGAGFYADAFGPLPFAFGSVPPEHVTVYEVRPDALPK